MNFASKPLPSELNCPNEAVAQAPPRFANAKNSPSARNDLDASYAQVFALNFQIGALHQSGSPARALGRPSFD